MNRPCPPRLCLLLLAALLAGSGCSLRKLAVNQVGNALAGGSGSTLATEDDPDLVRQAVPFSLKLMESLLAESPEHAGLLRALAGGFAQYSYAFVQQDADELEARDYAAAEALRARAERLYLRARDYGLRGLEVAHSGFTNRLREAPVEAVAALKRGDVPIVYWTAVAWGASIALAKDEPARLGEIPQMEALIERALALDEAWADGSIHSFLITYEMSRVGAEVDAAARAQRHFDRAMELSGGHSAGPLVGFAEAVCVQKQDVKQFEQCLRRALAIDADAHLDSRLQNLILQRRARWLLSREEDLFLAPAATPDAPSPAP